MGTDTSFILHELKRIDTDITVLQTQRINDHITILPWNYSSITQGTFAFYMDPNQAMQVLFNNDVSSANGDQINYIVGFEAGTWTFNLLGATINNSGILDILIDGVSIGTQDWYTAATTYNVIKNITGISINTGVKMVSLKINGKNAFSSSYRMRLTSLAFWRTA